MTSVYFLHITYSVVSHLQEERYSFPPYQTYASTLLRKHKEWLFFHLSSVLRHKKARLTPNYDRDFVFDIWQNALFLHSSANSITVPLSHVNSDCPPKKERNHFLFATYCLAFILQSVVLGLFPTMGLSSVYDTTGLWDISEPSDAIGILISVQQLPLTILNYWGKVICDKSKSKYCCYQWNSSCY